MHINWWFCQNMHVNHTFKFTYVRTIRKHMLSSATLRLSRLNKVLDLEAGSDFCVEFSWSCATFGQCTFLSSCWYFSCNNLTVDYLNCFFALRKSHHFLLLSLFQGFHAYLMNVSPFTTQGFPSSSLRNLPGELLNTYWISYQN